MFTQRPFNEVRYEVVGDELAEQYFVVNARSGHVYQRRAVQHEPTQAKEYHVGPLQQTYRLVNKRCSCNYMPILLSACEISSIMF